MTDHLVTAQEAQKLLEGSAPGPWEWETGEKVTYRNELVGEDGSPILACGALRWPDEEDETLIAAAPALARTVVHQAEKIDTLSRLLAGAEKAAITRLEQIERLQAAIHKADKWGGNVLEDLIEDDIITQEDMNNE